MGKADAIKLSWVFVLVMIVPGTVIMAQDPPPDQDQAIQEAELVATAPAPPAAVAMDVPPPPAGSWGIVSEGDGGGGIFRDTDSEAEVWLGTNGFGAEGFGSAAGGLFKDSDGTGWGYVGHGDFGIEGYGTETGGYFLDSDLTGFAFVGYGDLGINARGNEAGGYFKDLNGTGSTWVAWADYGIRAGGNQAGGYFEDLDGTGWAEVASGHRGIQGWGTETGGFFADSDQTAHAYVAHGDWGIEAHGNVAGGFFGDLNGSGVAYVGHANWGIEARGTDGAGYFADSDETAYAYVGYGERGIEAHGNEAGYFESLDETAYAYVGLSQKGILAGGTRAGGQFEDLNGNGAASVAGNGWGISAEGDVGGGNFNDTDGGSWASVASDDVGIAAYGDEAGGDFRNLDTGTQTKVSTDTHSVFGSGAKAFVQNHPYDRDSVIVYAALEGDEVATYTRGTARIVGGEAKVPLGETFKWVTNPDIGLTAHLTPRGQPISLAVVDLSTEEIVVRASGDAPDDLVFDYIVYGLRIGFEESSIVQEKAEEAYIPSMSSHRHLYERRHDLRTFNSLERFKEMRRAAGQMGELDLSRAQALRNAVVEFDPAVHEMSRRPEFEERIEDGSFEKNVGHLERAQDREHVSETRADHDGPQAPLHSGLNAAIPVDDEGNVYANSFRPSSQDLASLLAVSETVEPGDVLVIDRDNQGMMRRAFEGSDTGVIGVVAAKPGVVLGTNPPASGESEDAVSTSPRAAVALAGVVNCKVDADYGAVWPGDLLVTSPTPGHAMRADSPLPGTMLGKALEPLGEGTGAIRVLVMLR